MPTNTHCYDKLAAEVIDNGSLSFEFFRPTEGNSGNVHVTDVNNKAAMNAKYSIANDAENTFRLSLADGDKLLIPSEGDIPFHVSGDILSVSYDNLYSFLESQLIVMRSN